jgi:hypothetical protein
MLWELISLQPLFPTIKVPFHFFEQKRERERERAREGNTPTQIITKFENISDF